MDEVEDKSVRRLYLADDRGGGRYLRVTWHSDTSTLVFSHWHGDVCVASTRVPLNQGPRLVTLIVSALAGTSARPAPAHSPGTPPTANWRAWVRGRLHPPLAQVVSLRDRTVPGHDHPSNWRGGSGLG